MRSRKTRRTSVRPDSRPEILFEGLEARQLLATITWDGGGDGTTLTQASNWTGDVLPSTADDAVINVAGSPTITYNTGVAFSVNSLTCAESFNMSNGTITLAAPSSFSGATAQSGGTITGAGSLSFTSTFNWTGGSQSGSGSTSFGASAVVTLAGGTLGFNRDITNAGTVNWNSGNLAGFSGPGITFTNSGVFNANPSGDAFFSSNSSSNTFVNAGTFTKSGVNNVTFSGCVLNSSSALSISAGTLTVSSGGAMSAALTVASGATLTLNGGTYAFTAGATLAGSGAWVLSGGAVSFDVAFSPAGTVALSSGTLTLNAASQTIASLTQSAGTITGAGNLTISGTLNWTGGSESGAGTTTFGASSVITFAGGTLGFNRNLVNAGTVNWNSGNLAGFSGPGITFTNSGAFNANPSGDTFFSSNSTSNTFVNSGTFTKSGAHDVNFSGCAFSSTGSITISGGELDLGGGGSMNAALSVAAGTLLSHSGGTFSYTAGTTISGTGNWSFTGGTTSFDIAFAGGGTLAVAGGNATFNSTCNPAGAVTVSSGTLTLGAGSQTFASLTQSAGNITGPGNLNITSAFTWSGGSQGGAGTTSIAAAVTASFNGGTLGINRNFTSAGTINWNSGNIGGFSGPGVTFTNTGAFNANTSGDSFFSSNSTANTFVNSGTFTKSGTHSINFAGCIFNSTGAVTISAGEVDFSLGGSMSAAMSLAAGATITHPGGTFSYVAGSTLTGSGAWLFNGGSTSFDIAFSPAGPVSVTAGTLTLNAANQSIANLTQSSGTITGAGNLSITTALSWTGGSESGSGTTTFPAASIATFAGGTLGLNRNFVNAGTINWTTGNVGGFSGSGVTLTNNSIINVSCVSDCFFSGNSTPNTLVNNGTLNKSQASNLSFSNAAFTNVNTLHLNGGQITMGGGGGLGGTMALNATTFLNTTGGTFNDITATISGNGTARFQGGTHVLTGTLTDNVLSSIDSTTFTGAGDLIFNVLTDWNSGTMSGAGTTTIGPGVIWSMTTNSTKVLGRTLVNNGRINHTAGVLQFSGGGTLDNSAGMMYNLDNTASLSATGSNNTINNDGIFNKQTGGSTIQIAAVFNNTGTLNLFDGVLDIDGGGTNSGVRNMAVGTILSYRADYTHAAGSTASGSGTLTFNGGIQTIGGDWTSTAFMSLLQGTLDGDGTLTVSGPFTWGSGTMTGLGSIHISGANGKLALITGGSHVLARNIVNDNLLHFLNGQLTMAGATITNNAGKLFAVLPSATIAVSGGINTINNAGTLRKMGGGTITLDSSLGGVHLNNTGMVDVRNGTLNCSGPITQIIGNNLNGGSWQVYPTGGLTWGASVIRTTAASVVINLVGGGASLPNLSTLTTNNGTLNLSLGGIFQVTPFMGTFTNNGTIDLTQDRWFQVNGDFVQGASGVFNFDALTSSRYSRLNVSGSATLNGTVNFDFVGGFTPTVGVSFDFVNAGTTRTGTFTTTHFSGLGAGTGGLVGYTATGARVNIVVA